MDYQKLNEITKKDRYPIPRVDDNLDLLAGNLYFSCLDMKTGFWQIPIAPSDIEKTAFATPAGLFEFLVMPFGLCNAPSTFQRAMDSILAGLKWRSCLVYIDDVLVYSRDFETHLVDLRNVFERFKKANLKLKPTKCEIESRALRYLGFLITPDGIAVDPKKVAAVDSRARPTNRSTLRTLLGLTSYYRRFVKSYADVANP